MSNPNDRMEVERSHAPRPPSPEEIVPEARSVQLVGGTQQVGAIRKQQEFLPKYPSLFASLNPKKKDETSDDSEEFSISKISDDAKNDGSNAIIASKLLSRIPIIDDDDSNSFGLYPMIKTRGLIQFPFRETTLERLFEFLRIRSISSKVLDGKDDFCDNSTNCLQIYCQTTQLLRFVIDLWKKQVSKNDISNKPAATSGSNLLSLLVIQLQRRQGCSVEMHTVRKALVSYLRNNSNQKDYSDRASSRRMMMIVPDSIKQQAAAADNKISPHDYYPPSFRSSSSVTIDQGTNVVPKHQEQQEKQRYMNLLCSESSTCKDQHRLGLEAINAILMTDVGRNTMDHEGTSTCSLQALELAKTILFDEEVQDRLLEYIDCDDSSSWNTIHTISSQLPNPFCQVEMQILALQVLSNALKFCNPTMVCQIQQLLAYDEHSFWRRVLHVCMTNVSKQQKQNTYTPYVTSLSIQICSNLVLYCDTTRHVVRKDRNFRHQVKYARDNYGQKHIQLEQSAQTLLDYLKKKHHHNHHHHHSHNHHKHTTVEQRL